MSWFRRSEESSSRPSSMPQSVRSAVVGPATGDRYAALGRGQIEDWHAESAVRRQYLVNVIVYRCIQIRAEALAALPLRFGSSPLSPEDHNPNAPLAAMLGPLGEPNPDFSPEMMIAHAWTQYLVTGRFGWEIEWTKGEGNGQAVGLWPLISQYINPVAALAGQTAADGRPHYFKKFEYVADPARPVKLNSNQVFYHWKPSQYNIHQAESPLQAAGLDVAVAVKQDIYDNAFLDNDARPAGLLVTSEFESQDEYDKFESRLNDKYGGPYNKGKTMIVEAEPGENGNVAQSVNWLSLGISQKDADFFQRYEQKIRGIAIALGVPMSKLDASGRTYSNAEEEDRTFEKQTLTVDARNFQAAVNRRLAPHFGTEKAWFDLSSLTINKKQSNYTAESPSTALDKKYISLNMYLTALGEEPVDDPLANEIGYLEQLKNPEPEVTALEDPNIEDAELVAEQEPLALNAPTDQPKRGASDLSSKVLSADPKPASVATREAETARYWRSVDSQITHLETEWERAFAELFERQAAVVRQRLVGDKRGRQAMKRAQEVTVEGEPIPHEEVSAFTEALFTYAYWEAQTESRAAELAALMLVIALANLTRDFDGLGFSASNIPEAVRAYRDAQVLLTAQQVTNTTQNDLRESFAEGLRANEDAEALADRADEVFAKAKKNRAPLISSMSVHGFFNTLQEKLVEFVPSSIIAGKEWVSRRDARVRHDHKVVDGEKVNKGERFRVGGTLMTGPHDPVAPIEQKANCRCKIRWLRPSQMPTRSVQYVPIDEAISKIQALTNGEVR